MFVLTGDEIGVCSVIASGETNIYQFAVGDDEIEVCFVIVGGEIDVCCYS